MEDQQHQLSVPLNNEDLAAKKPPLSKYALGCAILASMTSVVLGYGVSVMSGAAIFIKSDLKLDDTQIEVVAGIFQLYSVIGSVAAGRTSDLIGRRFTMVFASAFFFVGALLMGVAPNYPILMIGRFFAGVGGGYSLMIAPVYTAEVAPASSRGLLSSLPEVFINIGVLLGYVSNYAFAGLPTSLGWRVMFYVGAVPPLFLAIAVLFMPESPRWLVMQGQFEKAQDVLFKTSDTPQEAELRLQEIKEAAGICDNEDKRKENNGDGVWKKLLFKPSPSVRRILLSAIFLQFFQQASGIDTVVLYSPRIFEKAGIQSSNAQLIMTVAVGFIKVIFILVTTFLSDRIGRKPLLLISAGGMTISLVLLASGLMIVDLNPNENVKWAMLLCVVTVLTFVASFSLGLGPIAWVYCSEIFPLWLRAQGAGLGVATNRITSGVLTMTFLSMYSAITIYGTFLLYAGIAAASWVFFYICLPETRGRGLEEMEELFGKKAQHGENVRW